MPASSTPRQPAVAATSSLGLMLFLAATTMPVALAGLVMKALG